jgi:hypothetical protein
MTKEDVINITTFEEEESSIEVNMKEELLKTYEDHAKKIGVETEKLLSAIVILYCRELLEKGEEIPITN